MNNTLRKIHIKRIGSQKWQWVETDTMWMSFDEALRELAECVKKDESIYAVKISVKQRRNWTEEFSGDRNFDYIGVVV